MADLTKQRRAELRRLAEEATPGPWIQRHEKHYDVIWDNDGFRVCGNVKRADASYIAAADPQTVLALLDALDVAEEAVGLLHDSPEECYQTAREIITDRRDREARAAVAARQGRQD